MIFQNISVHGSLLCRHLTLAVPIKCCKFMLSVILKVHMSSVYELLCTFVLQLPISLTK